MSVVCFLDVLVAQAVIPGNGASDWGRRALLMDR